MAMPTGVALIGVLLRRTRRSVARAENMTRDPRTGNMMMMTTKMVEGILDDVVLVRCRADIPSTARGGPAWVLVDLAHLRTW